LLADQPVVDHHLGRRQRPRGAQRQVIGRAGAGADEEDGMKLRHGTGPGGISLPQNIEDFPVFPPETLADKDVCSDNAAPRNPNSAERRFSGMAAALDDLDRKILSELQKDAEQSLDEIARRVGSSKTPVWNRIRKMKDQGVITRTTAILDPEALGLEACFFVLIRTSEHEADWQRKFLKALKERPEVMEAH